MRITVLLGGPSAEREVSLRSGAAVAAALRRQSHEVTEVDASEAAVRALRLEQQDVVFIALHGPFGEDGGVQSILEAAGIAYTGSDAAASRAAMDKVESKSQFYRAGVFTPPSVVVGRADAETYAAGASPLDYPVVVKPACQGSSIGVSLVKEAAELRPACAAAFQHGDVVLIERFIAGREMTVGFLGGQPLPIIELRPHRAFYDYSAKYEGHQTDYVLDTGLAPAAVAAIQRMAWRAFVALGCRDLGRVDLILDPWQRPFILEVNTIPGFTDHSLLPMAAKAAGIEFDDLCDRIVQFAWERRSQPR
jgi:D-alanine-D-alanine ligase